MNLDPKQRRIMYQALLAEVGRCDDGFGMLQSLGYGYKSDVWKALTIRRSEVATLMYLVGDEISKED